MTRQRLAAQERSRAIVEATLALFAREGFHGATTRRIASAAGVSEALVFKHFPTKDRLYRAILQAKIEESDRLLPLDSALAALGDEEFFLKIATTWIRRVEEDDSFVRLLLHSALEGHDLARQLSRLRWDRVHAFIGERIRGWNRGRRPKPSVDPALASRIFQGMVLSALLGRHIFKDPFYSKTPPDKLARAIVTIFLEGAGRRKEKE